jgi:hypothetical protein
MKFIKYLSLLIMGLCVLAPASSLFAFSITNISVENKGDFVLEPGKVELFVNPGDSIEKDINVTSRIAGATDFTVSTEDFVGSREKDQPVVLLGGDKSPYSFKDNIQPDTSNFTLEAGQKATLAVKVVVPANAAPGGYYSAVIVSSKPHQSGNAGVGTQVITRIGVLFFIRVNGPVTESGNIDDFRISDGNRQFGLLQNGPLTFEALFNNTGTVYLVPSGTITIKNILGQEVAELPVDAYFSLPNSTRYRDIVWPQQFLAGMYTATLTLNKGYGNAVDTRSITFWVIPWKYVGMVAGLAFIIALLIYLFTRKFEFRRKS